MSNSLASWVRAVAIATIVASVMLAFLIVSAEEIPALKNLLKATFYHHWLGKSVLTIGLFAVVSVALRLMQRTTARLSAVIVIEAVIVILSACSIAGFFLLHSLGFV